ncbi:MAG: methyltransferase domain-containing protein [Succinivibrio sp.]|nr:methyltransferase domain-containing protein [Succinivibrio sp.]
MPHDNKRSAIYGAPRPKRTGSEEALGEKPRAAHGFTKDSAKFKARRPQTEERRDFKQDREAQRQADFKARRPKASEPREASEHTPAHHLGFSPFQQRLVLSILTSVLTEHRPLDKSYAYWFAKVKIDPVEQGFIIRQINHMFRRLSFYAYVSGLKRPGDFEHHVPRLLFAYCAEHNWTLPELEGEEGFERTQLKKRLGQACGDPVLNEGCPLWLEELGSKEFGAQWESLRKALGGEAKRFIRVNTLKTDRDTLASTLKEEGVVTRAVKGAPLALEVTSSSALFRTRAFKDGLFEQQDPGSQAIGLFVGAKSGEKIIDACAGSGGKTLLLAAAMQGKGSLIALDVEGYKLEELKKRARRAGAFNIETRLIDSTKVLKRLYESADKVLVDAPCSGLGVLRRMPDAKWADLGNRLSELVSTQAEILERSSRMVKLEGELVYSTCSILPRENQEQVKTFLSKHSGEFELISEETLLPDEEHDGFYMAKLRRQKKLVKTSAEEQS